MILVGLIFFFCIYGHANQDIHSHASQSIIFNEINCDHIFTYEKRCCLKNMNCSKSCLLVYFDSHKIVAFKV